MFRGGDVGRTLGGSGVEGLKEGQLTNKCTSCVDEGENIIYFLSLYPYF